MLRIELMKSMRQLSLAKIDSVVRWFWLETLIEPFYPKNGNGRPLMLLEMMLKIHISQQWFIYSDTR